MSNAACTLRVSIVALLAEGVDRNPDTAMLDMRILAVALLAEGVDRNLADPRQLSAIDRRPPRGGRG